MTHPFNILRKKAFTLLEMLIVIVVMGIISTIGLEALVSSYENYIFTSVNSRLQSHSEITASQIANRLQYRIKDSVVTRTDGTAGFNSIANTSATANILEWVGVDREGWLGSADAPLWSGFIDLDAVEDNANLYATNASATRLVSPGTDTGAVSALINTLSPKGSSISDSALFFIGANSNINSYGWNGTKISNQNSTAHPITSSGSDGFAPDGGNFNGVDIYEYYKLAWSAYAIVHDIANKTLTLYYDYQPWEGEGYSNGENQLLMNNVTEFAFSSVGDIIKIKVCISENDLTAEGEYAICKEKTIF